MAGASHDSSMLDEADPPSAPTEPSSSGRSSTERPQAGQSQAEQSAFGQSRAGQSRAGRSPDGRAAGARQLGSPGGLRALIGRHRTFTAILATGVLLRLAAMLGYRPAMFFNDSFDYLHAAIKLYPHPLRPDGYSFFLLILQPFHSFALVVGIQHLMGLAIGVMIYALLRKRFRLPGWGAALATVPVLLDAYQIQLEHLVLSDVQFTFLIIAAITLVLWYPRPSWKVAALIGALLGMASLTRSIGYPVLAVALAYLLVRRAGWRPVAVAALAFAIPMAAYSGWFYSFYGKFAATESSGIFLYARVYKFADCDKIRPPTEEMPLCVGDGNRRPFSQDGIWHRRSPLHRVPDERFGPYQNKIAGDFAKRAILAQPGDYTKVVAYDFLRTFKWNRTVFPDRATYMQYEFGKESTALPEWRMSADATAAQEAVAYEKGRARTEVAEPFAGVIRGYQNVFYLRGSPLGVILLVGLAGMVPLWRRFGGPAAVPWAVAVGLVLAPAATAEFDYRYILPVAPLAALAAALAFAPEVRGSRTPRLPWRRRTGDPETVPKPAETPSREPALS